MQGGARWLVRKVNFDYSRTLMGSEHPISSPTRSHSTMEFVLTCTITMNYKNEGAGGDLPAHIVQIQRDTEHSADTAFSENADVVNMFNDRDIFLKGQQLKYLI